MKEFFERTETRTNSPNAFRILQVGTRRMMVKTIMKIMMVMSTMIIQMLMMIIIII